MDICLHYISVSERWIFQILVSISNKVGAFYGGYTEEFLKSETQEVINCYTKERKSLFLHSDGTSTIVDGRTNYTSYSSLEYKMNERYFKSHPWDKSFRLQHPGSID